MNGNLTLRWLIAALLAAPVALALAQQPPAPPQSAPEQEKPEESADTVPVPLPQGIRLFLKDGNYLLVREYKTENGRVRYWSVERGAWEEIPPELVDWDATHKGEAEDAARRKQIDEKIHEITQQQRAASLTVDTSIEAAPGVFLPDEPGFYIVANGAVASLTQDLAESHFSKKRFLVQVLTPIPVVPTKHNVEMKGARAKMRIHDSNPEFYFRTADQREPAIALIRARVHGSSRLITEINTNIVGESRSKENQVALERWAVGRGTFRYTLGQKLEPGEYAFVESVEEKGIDLYLWDFGVDAPTGAPPRK
jgi:hypothetical protein